jgi:lipopolysaccharide/colanic/teichoic acid biosynthesis glycosyltransferase
MSPSVGVTAHCGVGRHKVYEEVFERIPLSMVKYNWFLENISSSSHVGYGLLKRLMDIILAVFLGIFFLPLYPFVALAIKLDDQGPVFIVQDRVGRNNIIIKIVKFRSMAVDATGKLAVTRAGKFLRMSRIDELPQLWNVIWGELSLVGPRPELPDLVKVYEREIPYYNVRHLATPGLSGWGQVKDYNVPRGTADVDKTRIKLSYDLYYIKNRSFILDVIIALRTIRTLLSRSGN